MDTCSDCTIVVAVEKPSEVAVENASENAVENSSEVVGSATALSWMTEEATLSTWAFATTIGEDAVAVVIAATVAVAVAAPAAAGVGGFLVTNVVKVWPFST